MRKLDRFCEAIMAFEGWNPGSRSYRNCNPGNLRGSFIQHLMDSNGYCIFETFANGWLALISDVTAKCSNRSVT